MVDNANNNDEILVTIPGEIELLLLCLDHLRELRRGPESLRHSVIDDDYLTIACWALSQGILGLRNNDAYFDPQKQRHVALISPRKSGNFPSLKSLLVGHSSSTTLLVELLFVGVTLLVTTLLGRRLLLEMERSILYEEQPPMLHHNEEQDGNTNNTKQIASSSSPSPTWYAYDDAHASNGHRFFLNGGLACHRPPLGLGEICTAGLVGLGARSRLDAERDMMKNPLYEQFLKAVQSKGFFEAPVSSSENEDPAAAADEDDQHREVEEYENRYRKVVAKFRYKLCTSTPLMQIADSLAMTSADLFRQTRMQHYNSNNVDGNDDNDSFGPPELSFLAGLPVPSLYAQNNHRLIQLCSAAASTSCADGGVNTSLSYFVQSHDSFDADQISTMQGSSATTPIAMQHPADLEEAELMKNVGNSHMQKKEYEAAAEAYTKALQLSPNGPNSHVYYSNRAAALVSMKRFVEAVADSERSLAVRPDYGKAHARLGLAHFLMGNYRPAVEAYTVALKYEPGNMSSKNYLEKAAKRLAESGEAPIRSNHASFSVVSEWDQGHKQRHDGSLSGGGFVADEKEAEKYKLKGNEFMANRDHESAYEAYSMAIQLNPSGPQSHVYFSNRAAALCYLERYADAEQDSLKSLTLVPDYGKAYARLGLSRFFLADYAGAVSAYTKALEMDPDNAASKSYLAKADAKLREQHVQ